MLLTLKTSLVRVALLVLLVFLAWTPAASAWSWPLPGPVLQPFSYDESHPYAAGQHRGIDIGTAAAGDAVVAPAAGRISFAGTVPTNGKSVTIVTGDGYAVTLTHLGAIVVAEGATVAEGAQVGTVGPSGTPEVAGPYVHLGIRIAADPNGYVDPLGLLPPPEQTTADESGTTSSQPSSSGASSAAPAPSQAPSAAPASSPPATSHGSTAAPGSSHAPARSHERGQAPRTNARPRSSAHRHATSDVRKPRHTAASRHTQGRPASTVRRPVVETAAPQEPMRLDTGHEVRASEPVAEVAPSRREPSSPLVALILNGAAALVALGAALAASRRRRRCVRTSPAAGGELLHLPQRASGHRRAA